MNLQPSSSIRKVIVPLAGLLVVLAGLYALRDLWFPTLLRQTVDILVVNRLGQHVSVGRISGDYLTHLVLEDISSAPSPAPGTTVNVKVPRLEARYRLADLLRGGQAFLANLTLLAEAPEVIITTADPANTLSVMVTAPNDANLYGSFVGQQHEFVLLTCYPTGADNPRADYPLPTGDVVPHMQVGTDLPLFANPAARYPMIVFAHGYRGSPISSDYLAAMSVFASHGYIVVAPFYGDPRFSDLTVDNLSDAVALLAHLDNFTALQALRALSTSAEIDLMLSDPQWRNHIDATQIGGFGASMGGETLLLLGGAGLTTALDLAQTQVTDDTRLKAAVGYVPFFGELFLPAFGRDQSGLDGVTLPYLAISGTTDTLAPIIMTEQGINRLTGTRELVSLAGVTHGFDVASTNDIYTWALTFLDAEVRDNPAARQQLSTMASVAGGGDDRVVIPYN